MHNHQSATYSAIDIARIMVRDPDTVVDFLTYDRICDEICQGRAIESLSNDQKDALFSLEMGVNDLMYLGFSEDQIETFLDAYQDAYDNSYIEQTTPERTIKSARERVYLTAYTIAAFPYGPPIILTEKYNKMAIKGFTPDQTRFSLQNLTSRLSGKLMEKRDGNPHLFTTNPYLCEHDHNLEI